MLPQQKEQGQGQRAGGREGGGAGETKQGDKIP